MTMLNNEYSGNIQEETKFTRTRNKKEKARIVFLLDENKREDFFTLARMLNRDVSSILVDYVDKIIMDNQEAIKKQKMVDKEIVENIKLF